MKPYLSALVIAALALLYDVPSAAAQSCSGQFPPGTVCGNQGATQAPPKPFRLLPTDILSTIFHFGATCDGTHDDASAINAALVAATTAGGGEVIIPNGYTCAFGSTLELQYHTTLKIMENATLKWIGGDSTDLIHALGTNTLDDRMSIYGPGMIDAGTANFINVIHYNGGTNNTIRDLVVAGNSTTSTVLMLNGNEALTGGIGNWRLNRVDSLFVHGEVGTVIHLEGGAVGGPTNNSFQNIWATNGPVVHQRCVYAPRNNDTEYFYNLNCGMFDNVGAHVIIGNSTGANNPIVSGTYNSTTGLVTLTMSPAGNIRTGDFITISGLTGTGAFASLNGAYAATSTDGITVSYAAAAGLGATTITGGILVVDDTDAWGYSFVNYIFGGGQFAIGLFKTHDNSFIGGNDTQGTEFAGISDFSGGTASYIACHTTVNYNSAYICGDHVPFKVAQLPHDVLNGAAGYRAYVTDATTCAFNTAVTGGGSTFCPVIFNGSVWVGG